MIRPEPGEGHPRMPVRLDEEELADWHAGRNAVYQLAALTLLSLIHDLAIKPLEVIGQRCIAGRLLRKS